MAATEMNENRRHRWIMTPLAFGCLILMGASVKLIHASDQVAEEVRREYKLSPGARVEVSNINGPVEMSLAAGHMGISGVSGTAVIRATKLDEPGINISNVSGRVELITPADLNANINVNGNRGEVIIGLPHKVQEGTLNGLKFRAQIGSGGAPISISNIIGAVSLRRQ